MVQNQIAECHMRAWPTNIYISGYKVGDSYASYGNDVFPEFSSRSDDTVLAVKAHLYSKRTTKKFKRALVSHVLCHCVPEFVI